MTQELINKVREIRIAFDIMFMSKKIDDKEHRKIIRTCAIMIKLIEDENNDS